MALRSTIHMLKYKEGGWYMSEHHCDDKLLNELKGWSRPDLHSSSNGGVDVAERKLSAARHNPTNSYGIPFSDRDSGKVPGPNAQESDQSQSIAECSTVMGSLKDHKRLPFTNGISSRTSLDKIGRGENDVQIRKNITCDINGGKTCLVM